MDDPGIVCALESCGDLGDVVEDVADRQRPSRDFLLEGLALVMGHRDEELARGGLPGFVDRADVRVVERGCSLGFVDEAPLGLLVCAEVRRQKLERYRPIEPDVDRLVHDAHASAPESIEHAEMVDVLSGERVRTTVPTVGVRADRRVA